MATLFSRSEPIRYNEDQKAKFIKQEQFRTTIRKEKLETLYKQNRNLQTMGYKINHQQDSSQTPESLLRLFLHNGTHLDELCNAIDNSDQIEQTYYQLGNQIMNIKEYLCSAIQVQEDQVNIEKMFKLLNNIILISGGCGKKLLYNKEYDPTLIYVIQDILQQPQLFEAHQEVINTLILLLEQDNQLVQNISNQKIITEAIIVSTVNNINYKSLKRLAEYITLIYKDCQNLYIEGLYDIIQDFFEQAINFNDIILDYHLLLLVTYLKQEEKIKFCESSGNQMITKLIQHLNIDKQANKEFIFYFIRILTTIMKMNPQYLYVLCLQINCFQLILDILPYEQNYLIRRECYQFIKTLYKYYNLSKNYSIHNFDKNEHLEVLKEIENQFNKYTLEILHKCKESQDHCVLLVKTIIQIIEHFAENQLNESIIKLFIQFLDEQIQDDNVELRLHCLKALEIFISIGSLEDLKLLQKYIVENQRLEKRLNQLEMDNNREISELANQLIVLLFI